ncbi:M23 family metallopeptidase [Flavimarina sp. Hel_I_48]|uniref:M23 family metallopeptidase n=1 Tax=Flavimarina sp. Hel_I_48 TaxID=1392488 RepID=UPI0004DEEDE4|nr:M23 family metallopeptidase [Flavimarina sp. Hel_I_48]
MAKVKYYYDEETLSYKKIGNRKRKKFGITVLFIVGAFLAGFILLVVYLNIPYLVTPREKALQRELQNTKIQYDVLDKKMDQVETVLADIEDRDNNIYRVYFEANPIPQAQRKAGFGGVNRYKDLEGYDNSEMIVESNRRLDILTKELVVQSKSLDEIALLATEKEKLLVAIPAIQPVANKDLKRVASGYGLRTDPFTKERKMHWGMDFSAPRGTPIYATGNGTVTRADDNSSGYGNHVRIDHGYGYTSLYGHMYKFNVRRGQKVNRGDLIGFVGSTGRSEGPHVHYEIYKDGERINPINFYYGNLTPEEFNVILKRAQMENQSLD